MVAEFVNLVTFGVREVRHLCLANLPLTYSHWSVVVSASWHYSVYFGGSKFGVFAVRYMVKLLIPNLPLFVALWG